MRRKSTGGVVEDIWMNTQADTGDFDQANLIDDDAAWGAIEEENLLINPDPVSMDRG